jgi:hypothetical protein
VHDVVVSGAEQDEVVEVGAAAVAPVLHVVGLAPAGFDGASGELAVPVADLEQGALAPGDGASGPSDVERGPRESLQPDDEVGCGRGALASERCPEQPGQLG